MYKRGHCEFKTCRCLNFRSKNRICTSCNHANIWHYNLNRPPSDKELQFLSPRQCARVPIYTTNRIIPIVIAHPVSDDIFCPVVEALPV